MMEPFNRIFQHLREFRIIQCKTCAYAVVPDQMNGHLRDHHKEISASTRQQIVDVVKGMDGVARQQEDVVYPPATATAIQGFPLYDDGFRCQGEDGEQGQCEYICRTPRGIQQHCRDIHQWVNDRGRGGNVRKKNRQRSNEMWEEHVSCQRFFRVSQWSRYFQVAKQAERSEEQESIISRGTKILNLRLREIEEHERRKEVEADSHRYVANPWLKRAGWAQHLHRFDHEQLVMLIEPAQKVSGEGEGDEVEDGLWEACQVTRRLIHKAHRICQPQHVGLAALEYVNRRETGQKSNEKPLYADQMKKTIKKYSGHWVKVLCYIWRTYQRSHRPTYVLTSRQSRGINLMKQVIQDCRDPGSDKDGESQPRPDARTRKQQIEEACLEFWLSLLDHPLKDREYDSALVSGLAVLGVETEGGEWKSALNFTPILSAFVTVARMLVVYQASQQRKEKVQYLRQQGCGEQEAKEEAPSHVALVRDMVHRFMTLTEYGGEPTPVNWMLRLRTYGLTIRFNTAEAGIISWDRDEIHLGHIHFSMARLRCMVHGLVETTRQELWRDLLLLDIDEHGQIREGTTAIPRFKLDQLRDNPGESRNGWSFLEYPDNDFEVDGQRWLYHRVLQEERLRDEFIHRDQGSPVDPHSIPWNQSRIETYFRAVQRFKEHLIVAFETSSGATGRGTEVLTVQHRNSRNSGTRGLFIDEGYVAYVIGYHKGYGFSGRPKVIHRYLPREVGELVVYYVWLVQPFVEILQMFDRDQQEFGAFIWEPRGNEGDVDEDEDEDDEDDEDSDDDEDSGGEEGEVGEEGEGGEKDSIQQPTNVDGFWDSGRLRRVLQRETLGRMGVRISISRWRHINKAIIREYSRDRRVHRVLDELDHVGQSHDDIRDTAFGHTTHIGGMIYGRDLMESPHHTVTQREGFRRVSIEWHRFLQFASTWEMEERTGEGRGQIQVEPDVREAQFRRWRKLRQTDMTQVLQRVVAPNAQFRSVQGPALEAIMQRKSPILVIMGTGAGKSVLFQLPAASSVHGVTVVIVPLTSLQDDMKDRCDKAGISCVVWDSRNPADWASIILVTPEAAVREPFQHFVNRQRALGRLERYVFDECHVVLDSKNGWRPQIRELIEMTTTQCQLVYLTATLAPRDEGEFFAAMGLRESEVVRFRDRTVRPNVEYQVQEYGRGQEEEAVRELVEKKKQQYPMPGQIIVYCASVKQAVLLARVLECSVYHRHVGNKDEKKAILQKLTLGQEQVFTATNALGLGIDRPSIRVVIHVGVREKMRDYAQESGRAGRDGLKSEAIIMRTYHVTANGQRRCDTAPHAEPAMREYISGKECRRVILDGVMDDGSVRIRCEVGEEACDVCQGCDLRKRRRSTIGDRGSSQRRRIEDDGEGEVDGGREAEERGEREQAEAEAQQRRDEEEWQDRADFEEEQRQQRALRQRRIEVRRQESIEAQELQGKLEEWHEVCPLCRMHGMEGSSHTLQDCGREEARQVEERSRRLEQRIRFENYTGCRWCGIPQAICRRWVLKHQSSNRFRRVDGQECQFRRNFIIAVIVAVIYNGPAAWTEIITRWIGEVGGQVEVRNENEILNWWGQKIQWGGMEVSQLVRMFYWCVCIVEASQN
jgi:superfamily II DNA helicase RecQ